MKVAQYEVLGWRSERVTRPGLSAIVRMPPSLFELRRAREEKAAPQRSDGRTKEERDDRLPACAREAVRERRGAKRFYRPCRDEHFFVHRFSALRTGPLSLRPCGGDRNVCAWPTRDHSMFQLQCEYGYRVVFVGSVLVDRPSGTARVYRSIPGTSYRATFIESLRDRSAQARRSFLNAQARRSSLECQLVIANRRTGAEPVVGRFGLSR